MVRRRAPHTYHEPETHDPDSACKACGKATINVCSWCGMCPECHTGSKDGTQEY